MSFANSPSCNCCGGCSIASDGFSSLSSWTTISGTWNAASGVARTSSTNAVLRRTSPHPDSLTSHVVSVKVRGADGDIARVLVASNSAGTEYIDIAITFGDPCGSVSINGGDEIPIDGADPDTWVDVTVCYSFTEDALNIVSVIAGVSEQILGNGGVSLAVDKEGIYVGLGTGATASQVDFDDFVWSKGDLTEGCEGCVVCQGKYVLSWSDEITGVSETCRATITGTDTGSALTAPASITPLVDFTAEEMAIGYAVELTYGTRPSSVTMGPCRFDFIDAMSGGPKVELYVDGDYVGDLNGNGTSYQVSFFAGVGCASIVGIALAADRSITFSYATPPDSIAVSADDGSFLSYQAFCGPDCAANVACGACSVTGETPSLWKVVVSGMANDGCSDCSLIDGTYIMSFVEAVGPDATSCLWQQVPDGAICSGAAAFSTARVGTTYTAFGNTYTLRFSFNISGPSSYVFGVSGSGKISCGSIEDLVLPDLAGSSDPDGLCDATGATVKITAIL